MSRQGLSKRLFVIQKRSKVELWVPCELKVQRGQLVVAVRVLASKATLKNVLQGSLMSNLGVILLSLFTFCLECFDVCRQLVVVLLRTVVTAHRIAPRVIVPSFW